MSAEDFSEIIQQDNAFFKAMVDKIPTEFYFDLDTRKKMVEDRNMHMDKKVEDIEQGMKRSLDWSDKAKLKRARFDPTENRTVTQIQASQQNSVDVMPCEKKHKNKDADRKGDELKSSTSNLEELRQKLQAKIASLSSRRKQLIGSENWQERKKMKRRQSKIKQKLKQKEKQNLNPKSVIEFNNQNYAKLPKAIHAKPIFNKEGKMVFSKFDFSETGQQNGSMGGAKGKDFKNLLKKAEKQKEKFAALKEQDEEKAKIAQEKHMWQKAVQKAEGVKIRDNPELLKKAIKKKEKKKMKTKKDWDERNQKLEEKMKGKQEKRHKNIKKKKDSRIQNKVNKAKKKGRIIPGF